ncbi:MurR/RpiR family transcriptional regulator [Bacillaceae bacterium W0354]
MSRMNAGIQMLQAMLDKLPPSEGKIARYILEHPEKAITMTALELGKASKTSSAAVIRLCKSLNLTGFQELKLRVAGDLHKGDQHGLRDIEPNEPILSTIEKVTAHSVQSIKETANLIDSQEIANAIEALFYASKIHFFGVGASAIAAFDAQQKFLRIDRNATALTDLHMATTVVANSEEQDVVFGISFSGETQEVAKILALAKQRGAKTISLTKYGKNSVSSNADINLYTSATKEATFRSGATSSRLAQLHVIDVLFMCLASQYYEETVKYLDSTRILIDKLNKGDILNQKK